MQLSSLIESLERLDAIRHKFPKNTLIVQPLSVLNCLQEFKLKNQKVTMLELAKSLGFSAPTNTHYETINRFSHCNWVNVERNPDTSAFYRNLFSLSDEASGIIEVCHTKTCTPSNLKKFFGRVISIQTRYADSCLALNNFVILLYVYHAYLTDRVAVQSDLQKRLTVSANAVRQLSHRLERHELIERERSIIRGRVGNNQQITYQLTDKGHSTCSFLVDV